MLATAFALVFFYAPNDADQGFVQKIFYVHVPLAIVALIGFVVAGALGVMHLRTRDDRWDYRSYVAIHMGVIFGVGVLITGAIWAKAAWGKWWVWDEPTLVSFLIVFLLYVTYYPLRYSIEDPQRRARYASVFAITAGDMPGEMRLTFLVALAGMALLYVTLVKLELTSKHARGQLRRLRRLLEEEGSPGGAAPSPIVTVPAKPE